MHFIKKRPLIIAMGIATVSAALVVSFLLGSEYAKSTTAAGSREHPLLAKRLFISNANDTIVNFEPLRATLRKELAYYEGRSSTYFEYLPTGTSIRVGDTYQSVAASLLKVPAVMEAYKLAEMGKLNLDQKVSLKEEWLDDQYGTLYMKGQGHKLTIRELARIALQDSDNTAVNGILAIVKSSGMEQSHNAYNALDVEFSDTNEEDLRLNARSYSSFLKCLYFACYVSPDSSQEIMDTLTKSTEGRSGRLGKYIPDDVKIAHKIGVAGNQHQGDCGIVYVQNRNYVLCVMINDTEENGSEKIAQVSKRVYDYVRNATPQSVSR